MVRSIAVLGMVLLALAGVVVVRALTPPPQPPPAFAVPREAFVVEPLAATLAAAVRCPTWVRETGPDPAAFACLHELLRATYPRLHDGTRITRTEIGPHALLFEWRGSDPALAPVLLMAHQDVVPATDERAGSWTHDPFAGERKDGVIWGRGTLDDKGPLVTLLAAVERLLDEGFVPRRTVYIALGDDEEIGGSLGARAIAAHLASRGVRLGYVLDEGLAVTQGIMPGIERPVALIGVAEKGYITLGLSARRVPGHSSMPGRDTAISALARGLTALDDTPFAMRVDGVAARQFEALAPELPFAQRLGLTNLWLLEPLVRAQLAKTPAAAAQLRTTQAFTVVAGGASENVLPAEAHATINYRVHPRDRAAAVIEGARRRVEPYGVEIDVQRASDASPISSIDGPEYSAIERTIRALFPDTRVVPGLMMAGTDSRHFDDLSAQVYRFAPMLVSAADLKGIHGVDEHIAEAQLPRMAAFYLVLIRETAG